MMSSPPFTATTPARWTNTGAHDVLYSSSLPSSVIRVSGATIQPSRHPVINHDLENVFVLTTRSSGSAMSRNDGAAGNAPSPS